jgi:hypothetical protein
LLRVATPKNRPAVAEIAPTATGFAGLGIATIASAPTLRQRTFDTGTYYDAGTDGATYANALEPIDAATYRSVQGTGTALARSAFVRSADGRIEQHVPTFFVPVTENSGPNPTCLLSPNFTPSGLLSINNAFRRPTLIARYVQYRGVGCGPAEAMIYEQQTQDVFFFDRSTAEARIGAPQFLSIELSATVDNQLLVRAVVFQQSTSNTATTTPTPGIYKVYATVRGSKLPFFDATTKKFHLRSYELTAGAITPTLCNATGVCKGFTVEYAATIDPSDAAVGSTTAVRDPFSLVSTFTAIGGNARMTVRDNRGAGYQLVSQTGNSKKRTSLNVTATPNPATYGGKVTISGSLKELGTAIGIQGKTVVGSIAGHAFLATTDVSGSFSSLRRIALAPGTYPVRLSVTEDREILAPEEGNFADLTVTVVPEQSDFTANPSLSSVQYSDGITLGSLALRSGAALAEQPVTLEAFQGTASLGKIHTFTDALGKVPLSTLDFGARGLGVGAYSIHLTFSGDTAGRFTKTSADITLTVAPEDGRLVVRLPAFVSQSVVVSIPGIASQTVDGTADGTLGNLSTATATYSFQKQDGLGGAIGSPIVVANVPVLGSGAASGSVTLAAGLYDIRATLGGNYAGGLSSDSSTTVAARSATGAVAYAGETLTSNDSIGPAGRQGKFAGAAGYDSSGKLSCGMRFDVPNQSFTFIMNSCDWLAIFAITGGQRAVIQGNGTVNGTAGYHIRAILDDTDATRGIDFVRFHIYKPGVNGKIDATKPSSPTNPIYWLDNTSSPSAIGIRP